MSYNKFTHYLVPKEDGMLLGINKFPKVDLEDFSIKSTAIDLQRSFATDGHSTSFQLGVGVGYYTALKNLSKLKP